MLSLDNPRWRTFLGGYRTAYDASSALRELLDSGPHPQLWEELWSELHHQGDVDTASYAAVPWLAEIVRRSPELNWNPLSLIATIELARPKNPELPPDLCEDYYAAIKSLPSILGNHPGQEWNELVTQSAVACIALARGQRWYAKAYFELDRGTAEEWFSEEFGWDFDENE
jgi:hypothetical protein